MIKSFRSCVLDLNMVNLKNGCITVSDWNCLYQINAKIHVKQQLSKDYFGGPKNKLTVLKVVI